MSVHALCINSNNLSLLDSTALQDTQATIGPASQVVYVRLVALSLLLIVICSREYRGAL